MLVCGISWRLVRLLCMETANTTVANLVKVEDQGSKEDICSVQGGGEGLGILVNVRVGKHEDLQPVTLPDGPVRCPLVQLAVKGFKACHEDDTKVLLALGLLAKVPEATIGLDVASDRPVGQGHLRHPERGPRPRRDCGAGQGHPADAADELTSLGKAAGLESRSDGPGEARNCHNAR